ncbi:MAG: cation:proton antiporter [Proteobacteria bacterium]|nr:cation:proton antiporter [Pseudomonadota bacterium]
MNEHLPVLLVLVPLLASPLVILFRHRLVAWMVTVLAAVYSFYASVQLLNHTMDGQEVLYKLGNWPSYVGIHYKVDVTTAFILIIITSISIVVFPYAKVSVDKEIPHEKHHYFYAMLLLCFTGLMGMCITADAFNVFVFLEISSLSTYALIAMGKNPRALTAAYRYLVLGTIGGTFILLGIGFLYMMTGTLNMAELASCVNPELVQESAQKVCSDPHLSERSTIRAAFAFITVGVSIKLALWPLHVWLPNAYTYAPSVVSAFLAATATKVSFYVLLRAMFTIFGVAMAAQSNTLASVMGILALFAIFIGSITAISQMNIKRLLAYSSVAQIGYMALGLSIYNVNALTGSIIHLFNHALMKGGLFLVVGCMFYRVGSVDLKDLEGIGKRMPFTMLAFALGGLSMIGVPLTAGFVSKWYLVLGAFDAGLFWIAGLILVASLLAVIYVWKVIETAYFKDPPPGSDIDKATEAPLSLLVPSYVLIGASIVFGIWTDPMLSAARQAAQSLLGGAQ